MSDPLSVQFNCPNCEAGYEVVRIEEPPHPTDREVTCLSCGGPLNGREGRFILKYFLTDRPNAAPIGPLSRNPYIKGANGSYTAK